MDDLFAPENSIQNTPLAALARPTQFDHFFGQEHLVGPGKPLRRMVERDELTSLILYGPPGCGKTTLARMIAHQTKAFFMQLNAVTATVADIKDAVKQAQYHRSYDRQKTILFLDEVHRFNKSQQDVLMPYVEDGTFVFVGATTENPYFAINAPLISRSQVFSLKALAVDDLMHVLHRVLSAEGQWLSYPVDVDEDTLRFVALQAEGDARKALNHIEFVVKSSPLNEQGHCVITLEHVQECLMHKALVYDGTGDDHYDTISAFIKSMRGSDPDAAIYWLAKMLYAGEDINFIGRRIAICAAEDVGNAHPHALVVAEAAWEVARKVGMPEARIPLAQATIYVATAPKSNASYLAIDAALEDIRHNPVCPVPIHLRDGQYQGAKQLGHGVGYKYPHNYPGHYVPQEYAALSKTYYNPSDNGYEQTIKQRLDEWTNWPGERLSPNEKKILAKSKSNPGPKKSASKSS